MPRNRQFIIARMPDGNLTEDCFAMIEREMPVVGDDQLLLRTRYISIDAANRAWMQGITYRSALATGVPMAGLAISEVIESRAKGFAPGDVVFADSGWQDYSAIDASQATKQEVVGELTHLLSLYGTSTLTAYFGLTRIGLIRAGDTVVVSAAGGSVGVAVGQIAQALGARVVGITGGADKCAWLVDVLGFDAAIDYKAGHVREDLKNAAPEGIDLYFDNVGGQILETCLFAMSVGGHVVCCGAVSGYDGEKPSHGPRGVPGLLITKRLTMRGFLVDEFESERKAALTQLRAFVAAGTLRAIEDISDGLASAPKALMGLLAGQTRGKVIVRV